MTSISSPIFDHFGRMLDALPRHVGDVQQAVDAAQVEERAVVGQVLDHALDDRAFLQVVEQLARARRCIPARRPRGARPPRCCASVELDDLEFELLAFQVGRCRAPGARPPASRAGRRARCPISTVKPPLTLPLMRPLTISPLLERLLEARPRPGALGLLARQAGLAEAVLDGVQRDLDLVADRDLDLAAFVLELATSGSRPSDLRPAFTTTTSVVMSITRPVRIWPGRTAGSPDSVRTFGQSFRSFSLLPGVSRPVCPAGDPAREG